MLSSEQINQYHQDGFTVQRGMISKNIISELLGEIDRIVAGSNASNFDPAILEMEPNQDPTGKLIRRIYDPCTKYKPFINLSENKQKENDSEPDSGP